MTKTLLKTAAAVLLLCAAAGCGPEHNTPEWKWKPPTSEKGDKPRFIWVDAAANFPDFADSKENIASDLAKAKDAGFTDIVVDVRPTNGDVLFKTSVVDQVKWLGAWLPGGYQKVERTATWDYLQAFIDAGKDLDLRIHAGFNTFTGGTHNSLGKSGDLFRDASKREWATSLNLEQGIVNTLDLPSQSTKFFNPVHEEVQEYLCAMLADLAAYDGLDGIILDRGRFDNFTSDFSDYTRAKFEAYIGGKVQNFPSDILPAGHASGMPAQQPVYMKQWIEFRAKVIHDFMEKARAAVKSVNPDIKFGVYVGGWYSSYYDVGVNWASPRYDTSANYPWATSRYMNYGYADHMDQMLIGAYASPGSVYGSTEWTMEGFCRLAKERTRGDCPMVAGGPDVGNWDTADKFTQQQENEAITNSVAACYNACDGYFLFDMIHLKKADQWQYVKKGIDGVLKK